MTEAGEGGASPDDVLILTLGFDDEAFQRFDAMRRAHFPARRNKIPAHLTLFHKLPGERLGELQDDLEWTAAQTAVLSGRVTGLRFLGYGCAYVIEAPHLSALRADLATRWFDHLGPQDAQRFAPHVTIQNKAGAAEARSLFDQLESKFEPFGIQATGLLLWRYLGGPWDLIQHFAFRGQRGHND